MKKAPHREGVNHVEQMILDPSDIWALGTERWCALVCGDKRMVWEAKVYSNKELGAILGCHYEHIKTIRRRKIIPPPLFFGQFRYRNPKSAITHHWKPCYTFDEVCLIVTAMKNAYMYKNHFTRKSTESQMLYIEMDAIRVDIIRRQISEHEKTSGSQCSS